MQYFRKNIVLLVLIVLIAAFLRFWQLGSNPPSLSWDEVAWGYNAYSIGIDGKDEFGSFLPYKYLESFGDFKPPVYAYLDVLPVKLFGLNAFATRFPSALFGTLTVLITYFLVKRIFHKSLNKELYALCSAAVLALSPWHIMLSRAAFEANVATFFIATGVWLFLAAVQDRKWYLVLSAVSFSLSIYTFNTARIVSPLLVLVLAAVFWRQLWQQKKQTIVAVLVGLIIVLPTVGFLFSSQAGLRFREVNIFSDPEVVKTANQEIANDHGALWSKILHNRRIGFAQSYLKHYFDNLNPGFLFIHGDGNIRFSVQDVGEMYLWDLPFFIAGILLLWRKREGYWWLIPVWMLLGIIPAATARETPHALRIETTLPTFQIFVAYGLSQFLVWFHKYARLLGYLYTTVLVIIFAGLGLNVTYFLHSYVVHYPREYSQAWQYGYEDAIMYANSHKDEYDQIRVTEELGRPYIYVLFYGKVNPQTFRKTADITREGFGFVHVNSFGKYVFARDTIDKPPSNGKKVLVIEIPERVPKGVHVLKTFSLLNGTPALVAYTF